MPKQKKRAINIRAQNPVKSIESDAQSLVNEMLVGGASKTRIADAVGVTDQAIAYVSSGTTKRFRRMDKLQAVYAKWKAGGIDLEGRKGRNGRSFKEVTVPKKKRAKRASIVQSATVDFRLPELNEKMIADAERQIEVLKLLVLFMKELLAVKKKYGR